MKEVFESIRIIRQCLEKMEEGPLQAPIEDELPAGRIGVSSVEAPRGESHHFVITGENNRPHRWRVRAPTYQNLQAVPMMIKDQQLADMTISLGSIDPCFSCTDRLETIDLKSGVRRVWSQEDLDQDGEGKMNIVCAILGSLGNVALVLLVAPFFQGVLRKITALIQSRKGPPLWQPYFDLLKLLGKEDLESGQTPVMQRFAAYLSLATVLTIRYQFSAPQPQPVAGASAARFPRCGIAVGPRRWSCNESNSRAGQPRARASGSPNFSAVCPSKSNSITTAGSSPTTQPSCPGSIV